MTHKALLGIATTFLFLLGCTDPTPFILTIDNPSAEILTLDGYMGTDSVRLFVEEDGEWREVGDHDMCFRECGQAHFDCAGAPAPGSWAVIPGDTHELEYSGEDWFKTTDMDGECQKERALEGPVLAEVCFGVGVIDESGAPWAEDITESGFVFDAGFEEYDCVEVEFALPEDIVVVVELVV